MADPLDAASARTLSIPSMYGGDTFGGPAEGTITAHRITSQGLSSVTVLRNSKFADFATDWEREWSALLRGKTGRLAPPEPVIHDGGIVVGHFGWINAYSLLVPESLRGNSLRNLLLDGSMVLVRNPGPHPDRPQTINNISFVRPYTTEERFQLVMDVEGRALAQTGYDVVGLEPADDTFWLLISVGSLVIGLGRMAGRRIIASLISKATARETVKRVGRMSVEEMERFLIDLMKRRQELARLYGIGVRNLSGDALKREVLAALRGWEQSYGRTVQFVGEGVVQGMTRPGNLMSLQGDKLIVEQQVLNDSKQFFNEVAHELSADALGVRGQGITAAELAFVGDEFNQLNNALFILENSLKQPGGLKVILNSYRVAP